MTTTWRATAHPSFSSWCRGYTKGQTAVGNAEAMTPYSQTAVINGIGPTCSRPSQNSIDVQHIPFNLRDETKGPSMGFDERWAEWCASLLAM